MLEISHETNLQYISEDNPHLTSLFCEVKLDICSLTETVLKPNLRFVEPIVPPTIRPLPNYSQISCPTSKMSMT